MTPGKITTELTFIMTVTLVSEERSISDETMRSKTGRVIRHWVENNLNDVAQKPDTFAVEVVPRGHMVYDLRGLPS